jgi:hypothetical protein
MPTTPATAPPPASPAVAAAAAVPPSAIAPTSVSVSAVPGVDERFLDRLPDGVDQVPLLGIALLAARAADRAVAQLVSCLIELDEHQLSEAITGIPLEQWLAIVGQRTRSDRRMLLTTCDVLRRLPSLRGAFLVDGTISWAQTRSVALQVERLPRAFDDAIDDALARTIEACQGSDPDVLTSAVSRALRSIEMSASEPREAESRPTEEFLAIQPRLDGSGGSIYGEFDGLSLATIDAALTPTVEELRDARWADGELNPRGVQARGRGRRLVDLCDASLAGGDSQGGQGTGSRPQLLVRVELSMLLGEAPLPGELLTRLTGGRLWADASTVRQLVEERGADLRTVILDDCGAVVGVGRRTRVPTGWLRDATLALHDTCSGPGCQRPARSCDTDHARPWHATESGEPGGRTDIDELAPLCRTHNRTKESAGWTVTQDPDGSRTWHHAGTGLTTTTRPATWQPPPPRADSDPPPDPGDGVTLAREHRPTWDARAGPASGTRPDQPAKPAPASRPALRRLEAPHRPEKGAVTRTRDLTGHAEPSKEPVT